MPPWAFAATLALILLIGGALRSQLLFMELGSEQMLDGHPLLTSTDGYYFASGVGHALSDAWGQWPRTPYWYENGLVGLTALVSRLSGIAPEVLFLWLPIVLGPLIAIPVALMGRALGRSTIGLVAAAGAVVMPAYLQRSSAGYFDTDVFSLTVPLLIALFLLRAFAARPDDDARDAVGSPSGLRPEACRRDILGASIGLALYTYLYDQGTVVAVLMSVLAALGLVAAVLLARRAPPDRPAPPIVHDAAAHALLLALAMVPLGVLQRVLLVIVAHFTVALVGPRLPRGVLAGIAIAATLTAIATGPAVRHLLNKIDVYAGAREPEEARPVATRPDAPTADTPRSPGTPAAPAPTPAAPIPPGPRATGDGAAGAAPSAGWKRQETTGLVAEARVLSFSQMGERAAGHWLLLLVGLAGFALMLIRHPSLFVVLPLVAVGLFAFLGGHRFLMYLTPALSLGLAWTVSRLGLLIRTRARVPVTLSLGALALAPGVLAGRLDAPALAFNRSDAEALRVLDHFTTPGDLTLSWWDFGYPITYFAKTRNLTDGSRRGDDASLAAEILLTESPRLAARLARVSADALDVNLLWGAAGLLFEEAARQGLGPAQFLAAVEDGSWPARPRVGEVYLYLPKQLLPVVPVLEPTRPAPAGDQRDAPFMRLFKGVRSEGERLLLEGDVEVDARAVVMRRRNPDGRVDVKPLSEIHVVGGSGRALARSSRPGHAGAPTAGVLLRDLRLFVELENRLLRSQWAQLYFFENADPEWFEPVFLTPTTKIYRVR